MESRTIRHLTGMRVFWTLAAGGGLLAAGGWLFHELADGAQGPIFLFSCALLVTFLGLAVISLPWRLRSTLSAEGATIGWMLGKRRIPWAEVRRIVIGPMGSGKERDPTSAVLLLRSGEEILFAVLGRIPPEAHPAVAALAEAAKEAGIPVDNVLAPPEERSDRERKWREARIKGQR